MRRMKSVFLLSLALGLIACSVIPEVWVAAQSADPLVMVVNKSNSSAADMNKGEAKRLLLGEMATWPGGAKVVIVLKPAGNSDRALVLNKICNMSEAEYTRHNLQAQFMGEPMAEVQQEPSAAAARSFIRSTRGAVAFLRKSEVDDSERIAWTLP